MTMTENRMEKHGRLNAPEFISGDYYHLSRKGQWRLSRSVSFW